jgi:hypothetical protein
MDYRELEPKNSNKKWWGLAIAMLLISSIGITGLPPTTLSGLYDSVKSTVFNFIVPNYTATKITTGTLIETGNKNILQNPSFEHTTFSTGWTTLNINCTSTVETTVVIEGKQSHKKTCNGTGGSVGIYQDSTLYASQFADGVQGIASVRVKTDAEGIYVCPRQAGLTLPIEQCVAIASDNKWGHYKVPFVLGGTSNGIEITSNSATITSKTLYVDDAFVGAQDLKQDIDQSRLAGEAYFAGTTSCNWTRTSATLGAFGATAACPGPTILSSTLGSWQTTDSNLPRISVDNLPPGTYTAKFYFRNNVDVATSTLFAINDGTTTCNPSAGGALTSFSPVVIECSFTYTTSGNRVFELYAASSANTITVTSSQTSPALGTRFTLEYFGSGQIYSASCGANCVDTFSAYVDAAGTVSNENIDWINGNGTLSGGGNSITSLALKSGIFTVTPNCTVSAENTTGYSAILNASSPTSVSVRNFTTTVPTNTTGVFRITCQKTGADFVATRTIVGSFKEVNTTPGVTKPITVSGTVSSTGVVSNEDGDPINGNCALANTSEYTCTFTSNLWAAAPKCTLQYFAGSGAAMHFLGAVPSTTTLAVRTANLSNTATALTWEFICHGQGL